VVFGESASRVVVSTRAGQAAEVLDRAGRLGVLARVVGRTGGTALTIAVGGVLAIDLPVEVAERIWASAIDRYFEKRVA
jgi:hypothetical protein